MSRIEKLLTALLNGDTTNIKPRSRAEQYLKNCVEGCGCEGLPAPKSRLDVLLYSLADKLSGSGGGGSGSVEAAYEAGRKAEYDEFWDTFQEYGKKYQYGTGVFAGCTWTDARFKPKYDINFFGNTSYAFIATGIQDFKKCVEEAGVNVTFEGFTNAYSMFAYGAFLNLPVLNFSDCKVLGSTFEYCSKLQSIDKIIVNENTIFTANTTFLGCVELKEIRLEGTIAQNGLNLQWSTELTHDSIMSIINVLKDYSADTSGTEWKVKIGSENYAKLTEEEILIANEKGWNIE